MQTTTKFIDVKTGQPARRITNLKMSGKWKQEPGAFDSHMGSCSQNTPLKSMGHERNLLWLATRNNLCWGREGLGRVWDAFLKNMDTPACGGEIGLPSVMGSDVWESPTALNQNLPQDGAASWLPPLDWGVTQSVTGSGTSNISDSHGPGQGQLEDWFGMTTEDQKTLSVASRERQIP